jgi:PhoPQ-activated pathogenicity-related protein
MFPNDRISYITNEQGKKIVQMDIDVFEAITSHIEDEGLLKLILEKDKDGWLSPEEAKAYYDSLPKQS